MNEGFSQGGWLALRRSGEGRGGGVWQCAAAVAPCSSRRVPNNNERPDLPVYFRATLARAACHPIATACRVCDR